MIVFKRQPDYPQIEREFVQLDKRLYPIIYLMEFIVDKLWQDHLVVTRIKDAHEMPGTDNTHFYQEKPYRFIDIAILESGMENSEKLRGWINAIFVYGKTSTGKPASTIPPLDHGTSPHFHIQVRPL